MKQYKVICLNVGGHSNKIYFHGEIVREDQFLPGQAASYVKSGHVEEVGNTEEVPETPAVTEIPVTDDHKMVVEEKTETAAEPTKKEKAPVNKKKK